MATKPRLTAKQLKWVRLVIAGKSDAEAYKETYGATLKQAEKNAHRMRKHEGVMKELMRLSGKAEQGAVMTRQQRLEWLTNAIVTSLGDVDENSPLAVEVVTDQILNGDVVRKRVKKVDPLRALEILNKMTAEYTEKVEVTHITGLLEKIVGGANDQ